MRQWVALALGGLALAGCARSGTINGTPAAETAVERIDYETGPCFGFCPVYRLSVSSDGKGIFTGIRNTPVTGPASFTVSTEQYTAFRNALQPYRPASGDRVLAPGKPDCEPAATDMPSVDVRWSGGGRAGQHLSYYFGCRSEGHQEMADALGNAPELLPIVPLIGEVP